MSPACGPHTLSNNVWRDFRLSNNNGHIKYLIGKSFFGVYLPLKPFPATVANADIKSLNALHTFLKECLYHMLVKFEQNFLLFDKKPGFLKPFLTKRWRHFGRRFYTLNNCFMLNC